MKICDQIEQSESVMSHVAHVYSDENIFVLFFFFFFLNGIDDQLRRI